MSHDQTMISKILKANKEASEEENVHEMAIDMEFPQAAEGTGEKG